MTVAAVQTATRVERPGAPMSLDEALARMLSGIVPLPAEEVALDDAVGRFTAAEVRALVTVPPADNSSMDGFAVRAADLAGATRVSVSSCIRMLWQKSWPCRRTNHY